MSAIGGTVTMGRRWAEARMLDACNIGPLVKDRDPVTLEDIEVVDPRYTGKCRIASNSNAVTERDAGGLSIADESFVLSIPIAEAAKVIINDVLEVTAVDPITGNPSMVGRRFRIAGMASTSQATAARYSLELVS